MPVRRWWQGSGEGGNIEGATRSGSARAVGSRLSGKVGGCWKGRGLRHAPWPSSRSHRYATVTQYIFLPIDLDFLFHVAPNEKFPIQSGGSWWTRPSRAPRGEQEELLKRVVVCGPAKTARWGRRCITLVFAKVTSTTGWHLHTWLSLPVGPLPLSARFPPRHQHRLLSIRCFTFQTCPANVAFRRYCQLRIFAFHIFRASDSLSLQRVSPAPFRETCSVNPFPLTLTSDTLPPLPVLPSASGRLRHDSSAPLCLWPGSSFSPLALHLSFSSPMTIYLYLLLYLNGPPSSPSPLTPSYVLAGSE